jgi:putative pyruvate formate lyase activating enzyme
MLAHALTTGRLESAQRHRKCCMLCEHRCGVDLSNGCVGFCRAGIQARVFRHRVEFSEEIELTPSHLFYLSGCDLKCNFCIGGDAAIDPNYGDLLTGEFLQEALAWGRHLGPRNLQWVGGEPTIHLPAVLDAMSYCAELPPVVWKSNFHATPEVFEMLDGIVAVYVADFKFGNDLCAGRIAGISDYTAIVSRNLLIAANQADLIIRHLLLPGHFDCCYGRIVQWIKSNMPGVKFSIRDGYLPCGKTGRLKELDALIDPITSRRARDLALEAGLNVVE